MIKNSLWEFILNIYICMMQLSLEICCIYSYINFTNYVKQYYISKLILIYIICNAISIIQQIIILCYKLKYRNIEMNKRVWNLLVPTNRFPFSIFYVCDYIVLIIGIIIIIKYIPTFGTVSDEYYNSQISYISIISIASYTLSVIILFTMLFLIYFIDIIFFVKKGMRICTLKKNINNCKTMIYDSCLPLYIRYKMFDMLPSTFIDTNIDCSICLDPFINNNNYILRCGHKYHKECVKIWIKQSNNKKCPTCMKELNPIEIVEFI